MKNVLLTKGLLVALMALLLWLPLSMIEHTIAERTGYREEAVHAIAASSAGEQKLSGPVLSVSVQEEYDEPVTGWVPQGSKPMASSTRKMRNHTLRVLPTTLDLKGHMAVEKRAFGLYATPVFELNATLSGQFMAPTASALPPLGPNAQLTWGTPTLAIGVADTRGITGAPEVSLAGSALNIGQSSAAKEFKTGFQALGAVALVPDGQPLPFIVKLRIAGTRSLRFVPMGDVTTAEITGNWPHPSFGGDFLPRAREVLSNGFTAQWSTTALASTGATDQGFQVKLIEPVDIYQQALRSVKYGFLFIALSFAAFFLFEQLKQLRIHPIQYLLVGLAQATFFLLLTSLSEHIAFAIAYGAAATASVALVGVYLASVLHGVRRAAGFSAAMATLYAALFGILQSEQNALLLGSVLLFLLLAAFMLGTRKVDWYGS